MSDMIQFNTHIEIEAEALAHVFDKDKNWNQYKINFLHYLQRGAWTSPSLRCLDQHIFEQLDKLLSVNNINPFFIEAGANDGLRQSNTFNLEILFNFSGLLIEPNKQNFERCKKYRPNSKVINACLSNKNGIVSGNFKSADSRNSSGLGSGCTDYHLKQAGVIEVESITYETLCEKYEVPDSYAVFSLDVEGYESMVINKDTFQKYRPAVLCVETKDEELIDIIASQDYRVANRDASENDIIFVDRRLNEPF